MFSYWFYFQFESIFPWIWNVNINGFLWYNGQIIIIQVFLPINNDGHQLLLVFYLKYGSMIMFDQNKKPNTKKRGMITSVTVAEMLVNTISMTTVKFKLLVEIKWICTGYCDANHKNEFVQHNDFGRCLFGLKHIKSGNIVKAKLEIAAFEGQTVAVKNMLVSLWCVRWNRTWER